MESDCLVQKWIGTEVARGVDQADPAACLFSICFLFDSYPLSIWSLSATTAFIYHSSITLISLLFIVDLAAVMDTAGINSRSGVLDPFWSAFRVVLGRFERGVHARSDEWVLSSFSFLSDCSWRYPAISIRRRNLYEILLAIWRG